MSDPITVVLFGAIWLVLLLVVHMAVVPQLRRKIAAALQHCRLLVDGESERQSRHYPYFKAEKELERLNKRGHYVVGGVFFGGVTGIIASAVLSILFGGILSPGQWYSALLGTVTTAMAVVALLVILLGLGTVILWMDWNRIEEFEKWLRSE